MKSIAQVPGLNQMGSGFHRKGSHAGTIGGAAVKWLAFGGIEGADHAGQDGVKIICPGFLLRG